MSIEHKRQAAATALNAVKPGMKLGLGSGSTSEEFIKLLGEKVAEGLDIVGVPTSEQIGALAASLGIKLTTLDACPELDLTVDGADEIGPGLALIKGGGGALLREKIVATASKAMIVIADSSKLVSTLGEFPLPIEVNVFGLEATRRAIIATATKLGISGTLLQRMRPGHQAFVTDGGHYILDASFRQIPDPEALARALTSIPGVVEHGLFIGIASEAIVAGPEGVTHIRP